MTADWQEPGAHPVAPGIHRIPLPLPQDGLRAVNVYAVTAGSSVTMIDAGWASWRSPRRSCEQSLKQIDAGLGDIDRFLVTHVHRDHYTQAVAVRREFGTRVSLGIGEQPVAGRAERHPVRRPAPRPCSCAGTAAREVLDELVAARLGRPDRPEPTGSRRPTG